jgi:acetylglutamate kinase
MNAGTGGRKPLAGTIVVKLGGSTLGSHDTTLDDLVELQKRGMQPVVVHGGANVVTDWLKRLSIPTRFVKGLRVTDAETLRVVIAILAGLVNKELVAAIDAGGGRAVGLSGIDGGLLEAVVKDSDMGHVGEVSKVNPALLLAVLEAGFIPVVAPLSLQSSRQPGENGFVLNVNGDTAAGMIAAALPADELIFLTDVAGILNASGELIAHLSRAEAKGLLDSGVASGGMIPKIEACLAALAGVRAARIIDGTSPHALIREVEGSMVGTTIG